jgi:hypothetical protein
VKRRRQNDKQRGADRHLKMTASRKVRRVLCGGKRQGSSNDKAASASRLAMRGHTRGRASGCRPTCRGRGERLALISQSQVRKARPRRRWPWGGARRPRVIAWAVSADGPSGTACARETPICGVYSCPRGRPHTSPTPT